MKNACFLFVGLLLSSISVAHAGIQEYQIDDAAVEAAFEVSMRQMSAETSASFTTVLNQGLAATGVDMARVENPDAMVATLLAFFLGYYGIHRVYLGGGIKHIFLYIITFGGFGGIIPIIDGIVLLIGYTNDDISKYVGNTKFIMWSGKDFE